jgi:hypothetical protein
MGAAIVAAGAIAGAYLFDPEHGGSRRDRIAQRAGHGIRRMRHRINREIRHAQSTVGGRLGELIGHPFPGFADGGMLLDRVESELFEDRSIPHGKFNLEVEGTTVVLRGQLDSRSDIKRVEEAVLRVPGVDGVRNLMHVPGTPAPNKAEALAASAEAASDRRTRKPAAKKESDLGGSMDV